MTKLSPAQLAILRRMGEGERIALMMKGIRHDTLFSLARRGLIEDMKPDWAGGVYTITPAGRAYLEEHDG